MDKPRKKRRVSFDTPLDQGALPERLRLYCQKRGVQLVGEIYQIPFDRNGKTPNALDRFLQMHRLPSLVHGVTVDWRPDYVDDDAIRKLWDRPVGDLFLRSPQEPYETEGYSPIQARINRWIHFHHGGHHYVGQALQSAQRSQYYLQDLQVAIRIKRWPLHAAMLVLDWKPPVEVPTEWSEYVEKVGLPEWYRPPAFLSEVLTSTTSADNARRHGMLTALLGSVERLDFSVRTSNTFKALDIGTIWELVQYPLDRLIKARNFGQKSLTEVQEVLMGYDLKLEMSEHELVRYITNALCNKNFT